MAGSSLEASKEGHNAVFPQSTASGELDASEPMPPQLMLEPPISKDIVSEILKMDPLRVLSTSVPVLSPESVP